MKIAAIKKQYKAYIKLNFVGISDWKIKTTTTQA